MTVDEYKLRVIELFQSGKATPVQWREMASCVLYFSEQDHDLFPVAIDAACMRGVKAAELLGGMMDVEYEYDMGHDYDDDIERDSTPKGPLL